MSNQETTFYIVRHGQTEHNQNLIIQGHADSPLTQLGEQQARDLAVKFKGIKFDVIFSSDLLRAKRTADIIAKERELAVISKETIRERSFGKLEGKSSELFSKYDGLFDALSESKKYKYKMEPDVESDEEIATRLLTFIRETSLAYPGKNVLTITHGGIMRALLIHLGYGTYKNLGRFMNTAYFVLKTNGSEMVLKDVTGIESHEDV